MFSKIFHPDEGDKDDLIKKHERMMYVIKALGGGIWEFDVASGELRCSRRWHDMMGLDYDTERVTSVEQFKAHIHPEDVERTTNVDMEELRQLIARDERYAVEFRVIHRDGTLHWIRSVASLISEGGQNVRAIGCITDITSLLEQGTGPAVENDPPGVAAPAAPPPGDAGLLSAHEVECLRWVVIGKTAKETASILGKSPRTIEFHLKNAMHKLDAVNKVQAAVLAIQRNLL